MNLSRRDCVVAVLVAIPFLGLLGGYQAGARVAASRPSVVATVDLSRVINDLHEADEWRTILRQKEDAIRSGVQQRRDQLTALAKQIEAAPAEQREDMTDDFRMQNMEAQSWVAIAERQLDGENALMWQSLYRNIRSTLANIAETEGYDVVVVNDSTGDLSWDRQSQTPATQQVMTKIAGRRVLYAGKEVDITEKLIVRMNNTHTAGSSTKR